MEIRINYDANWEIISGKFVKEFIQYFLPKLYRQVDWSVPPEFLEQEMHEIVEDSIEKKILDKLIKFRLKSGEDKWIFVHTEFQGEGGIGERMFTYFRRILDKYGKDITALVIYTGSSVPRNPNKYKYESFGTKVTYEYNTYIVKNQKEATLIKDKNPFSIVVLANLYTVNTTDDEVKRLEFKKKLFEIANFRNYDLEKTTELFIFVKELMQLSSKLEKEFDNFVVEQLKKEEENMRVISPSMHNFLNRASIEFFGKSFDEAMSESEKAKSESEKAKSENLMIKIRSIINLKDKMNLTIEQIASILEYEVDFVTEVLSKYQND
jgi:hypothetical protein